ncbi:hypothetical protein MIND_00097700 [Mycena indigotica]|uniref:Uncharacterized protein n=1 Tax=Mycena indigotica TaxID=2126181 RepID=A0A8H6TEB0_9AGAR|nr:uncharacterized protein MIND_00097700 [Mycena indigotica]KAF7315816.1 hypothetical protein MIND_00097700 [Mycena indigotica]
MPMSMRDFHGFDWDISDDSDVESCFDMPHHPHHGLGLIQAMDPYTTIIAARALVEEVLIQLDVFTSGESDADQDLLAKGRRLAARYDFFQRKLDADLEGTSSVAASVERYYAECKEFQQVCTLAMREHEGL